MEDASHLFRGCVEARFLWSRLIKVDKLHEFLHIDIKQWVVTNLNEPNYFAITAVDWDILFSCILWTLWRTRNARLFSSDSPISDNVMERAMRLLEVTLRARLPKHCNSFSNPRQPVVYARWAAPPCHWIKVNTDGARNTGSGLTTCEGVGRDSEGYTRVILEMDCRDAYKMLAKGNPRQLGSSLLPGLLEMRQRSWDIQFHFIRRERNQAADMMARLAWCGIPEYRHYMDPPSDICDILISDRADLHSVMD
ncbi:hypothetical protein V6N12_064670 [Hibiscus sabdariffa]|uniref:RNase H type-1 domain-containing protein n=1 Tax=Hibiscus sabdariffa TaxID=183260 RepID=A0ABR2G6H0_9ROSI